MVPISAINGWPEGSPFSPSLGLGDGKVGWRAQGVSAPHPGRQRDPKLSSVHISALEWPLNPFTGGGGRAEMAWIAVNGQKGRKVTNSKGGTAF